MRLFINISVFLVASFSCLFSQVEEKKTNFDWTTTAVSRYVWRGYDLSHKDPALLSYINYATPVTGLTLSGGIIFGLDNKASMGDYRYDIDEFDLSLIYDYEILPEKMSVIAVLQYYRYTSQWTKGYYVDQKDIEASVEAWYSIADEFTPMIRYFRGLDKKIQGNYFDGGFYSEFELIENALSLNPNAYAGYSMQYEFRSAPAFSNIAMEVPLTYRMNALTCSASVNFSKPLKKVMNGSDKIIYYWGISAAYKF
jgi:hypothetical protein